MTFEKTKFNQLTTKQKVLIPLIIVAIIYVVWQVYDMFGGGSSSPTPAPSAVAQKTMSTSEKATISSPNASTVSSAQQQAVPADQSAAPKTGNISDLSGDSSQLQYVQMLNQYQLLKMKRMLLEEQVAIASARQKIADLNSKTSDLGGSDSDMDESMGLGDEASNLTVTGQGNYKVVYIDRQNGEWNATLSYGGKFMEVNVGSELADGTQVISIDSNGVILKQGTKLNKVNFSGSNPVSATTPPEQGSSQTPTNVQDTQAVPTPATVENKDLKVPDQKKKKITTQAQQNKEIGKLKQQLLQAAPSLPKTEPTAESLATIQTKIVEPAKQKILNNVVQKEVVATPKTDTKQPISVPTRKNNIAEAPSITSPSSSQPQIIRIRIISQSDIQKATSVLATPPKAKEEPSKIIAKPVAPADKKIEGKGKVGTKKTEEVAVSVKAITNVPAIPANKEVKEKPAGQERKPALKEITFIKETNKEKEVKKEEPNKIIAKPVAPVDKKTEGKGRVEAKKVEEAAASVKTIANVSVTSVNKEAKEKSGKSEQKPALKEITFVKEVNKEKEIKKEEPNKTVDQEAIPEKKTEEKGMTVTKKLKEAVASLKAIISAPAKPEEKRQEKPTDLEQKSASSDIISAEQATAGAMNVEESLKEKGTFSPTISDSEPAKVVEQEKPAISKKLKQMPVPTSDAIKAKPINTSNGNDYSAASKDELRKLLVDLQKNAALKQVQGPNGEKDSGTTAVAKQQPKEHNEQHNAQSNVVNSKPGLKSDVTVRKTSTSAEPIVIINNTKSVLKDDQ